MPLPPLHVHLGDLVAHVAKTINVLVSIAKQKKSHLGILKTEHSGWYKVFELPAVR